MLKNVMTRQSDEISDHAFYMGSTRDGMSEPPSFFVLIAEGENAGSYEFVKLAVTQSCSKKGDTNLDKVIEQQYQTLMNEGKKVVGYPA